MDGMEEKLGAILNNPQMMQQIMNLAQSMNTSAPQPAPPQPQEQTQPAMDMTMLSRLGNLAKKANIDRDQQSLLSALRPYLSREKISKLERAMQAAKMAGLASTFMNAGGMQFLTGR